MKKSSIIVVFTLVVVLSGFSQGGHSLEYSGALDTYYHRGPVKFVAGLGMGGVNNKRTSGMAVKEPSPFGLVGLAYQWFPRSIFVTELSYIKLKQTDQSINSSFDFTNIELNVHGRFYLLDDRVTKKIQKDKTKFFRPYVMTGLSAGRYATTYTVAGTTVISEKGPRVGFSGLFGFGFAFQLSNFFSVSPEITKRTWLSKNNKTSNILDGYTMAGIKVHYNPWARKKKKKRNFKPPLTPTQFNSPHGVGANDERRKKELEGVPIEEEEFEVPEEEEGESDETPDEESNPFEDFEKEDKKEKDPFDF